MLYRKCDCRDERHSRTVRTLAGEETSRCEYHRCRLHLQASCYLIDGEWLWICVQCITDGHVEAEFPKPRPPGVTLWA